MIIVIIIIIARFDITIYHGTCFDKFFSKEEEEEEKEKEMESGENKRGYSIILEPDKNLCSVFPTSVLSRLIFLEEKIHGSFVRLQLSRRNQPFAMI